MQTSEETKKQLDLLYKTHFNSKFGSENICQILKKGFPSFEKDLESLVFQFSASETIFMSKRNGSFSLSIFTGGKNFSPLKIASGMAILDCQKIKRDRRHFSVDRFEDLVELLSSFDPKMVNSPPDKRQLKIFVQWYVENVSFKLVVHKGHENNEDQVWEWESATKKDNRGRNINEYAYIHEKSNFKDLCAHILTTGNLPSFPSEKEMSERDQLERI